MLRLYLVRHGITIWNHEGRLQGHTDVALAPEGIEQAQRIAHRLAGKKIDAVWSSDLARARATADAIADPHGLTVQVTPLLRETMLGAWEGMTKDEIIARGDEPLFQAYRLDPMAHRPPGAELLEDVWTRLHEASRVVREGRTNGNIVVVGHGGSLRVFLCEALGAPLSSLRRIWLDNASLSLVECADDRMWVRLVNDISHLG